MSAAYLRSVVVTGKTASGNVVSERIYPGETGAVTFREITEIVEDPAPFYCQGKDGFATPDLARKVARAGNRAREGRSMCAYRCEHCRLWHVGHNPMR